MILKKIASFKNDLGNPNFNYVLTDSALTWLLFFIAGK